MKCSNSAAKWRRGKPLNILLAFFILLSFFLENASTIGKSGSACRACALCSMQQSSGNPKLMACQSQSSSSRSRSRTANTALSRVSGLSTPPCWPLLLLLLQNAASFRLQLQGHLHNYKLSYILSLCKFPLPFESVCRWLPGQSQCICVCVCRRHPALHSSRPHLVLASKSSA